MCVIERETKTEVVCVIAQTDAQISVYIWVIYHVAGSQ